MKKYEICRKLGLLTLGWLFSYPIVLQMTLTSSLATPIKFKLPTPPQRGISGNRSAAASRDKCPEVAQPLTALVPEYRTSKQDQNPNVWSLTGMERPTFLFYIPYAKNSIVNISFTLQDESNPAETGIVYENLKILPAQTPGVMQVVLPNSVTPLAPNKPYHWFLNLNMACTIGQRPIYVEGWLQRVDVARTLRKQLEGATPLEQVALYADNGLWSDALTTLANLRAAKPKDPALSQDWRNLLDSIELGHLASQPFADERRSARSQESREKSLEY